MFSQFVDVACAALIYPPFMNDTELAKVFTISFILIWIIFKILLYFKTHV